MAGMARPDGRKPDELRPVTLTRAWSMHAEGSVLVDFGDTRVLCTASVTGGVPRWRKGSGLGWVTSEYAMLPRATTTRNDRESIKGRVGGRTHEISRLIGRSLRACIDLGALGENSVVIDCDVLQADGGTRTAAITGAYVALTDAVTWMAGKGMLSGKPEKVIHRSVSAVSVGVIDGEPRLDLCYAEDGTADVDMNIVCTGTGEFVEVQGTGEHNVFGRDELDTLLDLGVCRLPSARRAAGGRARGPTRLIGPVPMKILLATRNAKKLLELATDPGRRAGHRRRHDPRSVRCRDVRRGARVGPHVRRQRAAEGSRGRRAHRPADGGRRLGARRRRHGWHAGHLQRPLVRQARRRRRESRSPARPGRRRPGRAR